MALTPLNDIFKRVMFDPLTGNYTMDGTALNELLQFRAVFQATTGVGAKGDTGATGPAGPTGATGAKGDKGDPGSGAVAANTVNALSYGAIPSSDTIQAAYDAAAALAINGQGALVDLSGVGISARLFKPLRLYASNVAFVGAGRGQTQLTFALNAGAMLAACPETGFPLVADINGGTNAFQFKALNQSDGAWFNFSHDSAKSGDKLHGASQFCAQIWLAPTTNNANDCTFFASYGQKPGSAATQCFGIGQYGASSGHPGAIFFTLHTSGATKTISSNVGIASGVVTRVTCDYDGSTMRILFKQGSTETVVASVSQSGTLVRNRWEQTTLGATLFQSHTEILPASNPADPITISSVGLSVASVWNGTGAAAIGFNSNMQLYLDFNTQWGNYFVGRHAGAAQCYYFARKTANLNASNQLTGVRVAGLKLAGVSGENGMYVMGTLSSDFRDITIETSGGHVLGIYNYSNSYYNTYTNISLKGGDASFGFAEILSSTQSGLAQFSNCYAHTSAAYAFAVVSSGGGIFINCNVSPEAGLQAAFYGAQQGGGNSSCKYISCSTDIENGALGSANFEMVDVSNLSIFGFSFSNGGVVAPHIKFLLTGGATANQSCSVLISGCDFYYSNGSEPYVLDVSRTAGSAVIDSFAMLGCSLPPSGTSVLHDPNGVVVNGAKVF